MNIGVIGVGLIGKEHIRRMKSKIKDVNIKGVYDIDVNEVKNFLKEEEIVADIYHSSVDLINSNDIDAVVITSWGETHEELVMECLEAKKPVFCEKPLATTLKGCERIVEKEIELGKRLIQVGYMRRFDQSYNMLKEVVDSNEYGEPLIIRCAHRIPSHPRNEGNMAITEASVHEIDIVRWLIEEEFVSTQVLLPKSTNLINKKVQDPLLMILETESGVVVEIETFINSTYGYDISCHIVSEKGIVYLPEPANVEVKSNFVRSKKITRNWKERFDAAYDFELIEWINAVKCNKPFSPSAWDGYLVAVVMDACIKAKETGAKINIEKMEMPMLYRNREVL